MGIENPQVCTLCFPVRNYNKTVSLGKKKQGHGQGKWNGYGGKVKAGEAHRQTAARELFEEAGISARGEHLEWVGIVKFYRESVLTFVCYVYIVYEWQGNTRATEEMIPQWFPILALPLDEMWAVDRLWIPEVLAGKHIYAHIDLSADGNTVLKFTCTFTRFD
ncbi:MAG: NUDIX domain-containing protein [Candidatus Pacebacteria bacterium]|nr:NUDIX domain-containing protein [Candidatus Paceibacterota bacterium]